MGHFIALPSSISGWQLDLDPPASLPAGDRLGGGTGSGGGGVGSANTWGASENGSYYESPTANESGSKSGGGAGVHAAPGSGGMGNRGVGGAWGGSGTAAGNAGATSLDEALVGLFGGESVTGIKGRQNVEVKSATRSYGNSRGRALNVKVDMVLV